MSADEKKSLKESGDAPDSNVSNPPDKPAPEPAKLPIAVVVNDNPTQLSVLAEMLRKAGLEPLAFTGAEAALAAMSKGARSGGAFDAPPAIIVTDLYMPGIDGWRFCRLLRSPEYAAFNQVPILVVSATFAGDEASRIAADLGAEVFPASPVDGQLFREKVRAILSGERVRTPLRVLIVDDNDSLCDMMKLAFTAHGYHVDTAFTFRAAAEAFRKNNYDVAVLDYHLPDGCGDALLDAFRAERPDCVCLIMTSNNGPDMALDLMKRGAAAFLQKPFKTEYLIELCARARRERALLRAQDLLEVRTRELRESESHYRELVEGMPGIVYTYSTKRGSVYCSSHVMNLLGYSPEQLYAQPLLWHDSIHPDDCKRIEQVVREAAAGKQFRVEYRIRDARGNWRWFDDLSIGYKLDGPDVIIKGLALDITARKQAEEALQESETRFRELFSHMSSGVAVYEARNDGQDFVFKDFNQAAERIEATLREAVLGRSVVEVFPGVKELRLFNVFQRVWRTGQPEHHPAGIYRDNHIAGWRENYVYKLPSGEIVAVYDDITERKQVEEALRESEEKFRNLFHNAEVGMFRSRLDGSEVLDLNDKYLSILGRTREETLGKPSQILWADPTDREEMVKTLQAQGHVDNLECRLITKDGKVIHCITSVRLYPEQGILEGSIMDITERKRAEEALRESSQFTQQVISSAKDGVIVYGPDLRYLVWNPVMEQMSGVPASEVIGKHPLELFPFLKDTGIIESLEAALKGVPQEPTEFKMADPKSGADRWTQDAKSPIRNAKGEIIGAIGIVRDVTERKRAEEELRESEDRYRSLVEESPDAIGIYQEGKLVFINSTGVRQLGAKTKDELLGRKAEDLIHPEDQSSAFDRIRRRLAGEMGLYPAEVRYLRLDGTTIPVEVTATPITFGQAVAVQFIARDITERKRAETALRESEARLNEAQSIAHLGNWERDHLTNTLLWSDETYRIFEITKESFFASYDAFIEAIHPEDRNAVKAAYAQSLETRKPYEITHRLLMPDGRVKFVLEKCEIHYSPDGIPLRSVGIVQDITERKALEAQFQQAQKMESVGQLAGGVAHDFNNILAATMMHLGFLQENPNLDARTQESLRELMLEAQRAASLTRQLLMFSRRSVMEVKVLDLNELVANLLRMLGRLIGEHIHLRFDLTDGLPTVEADPGMIEQVIMNLAINARDAMPANGGKLSIRIESIMVGEERAKTNPNARPGQFVCLSVADTGSGMDEATLQHIFEPFFTTKDIGKGTGLGLATVHGIVAQHKGWVEVESELGKGTTFKVFLPAITQGVAKPATTEKMAVIRGHETILLVEDEASLRRLVAQGLRRLGYTVFEADNGQTALMLWQEHSQQIDLLFSDMVMPEGFTGLDLAEKLRQEKPKLKVIISSGYNMEMAGQGRPAKGGIMYLQKPYQIEVLSKTVRDCLDRA